MKRSEIQVGIIYSNNQDGEKYKERKILKIVDENIFFDEFYLIDNELKIEKDSVTIRSFQTWAKVIIKKSKFQSKIKKIKNNIENYEQTKVDSIQDTKNQTIENKILKNNRFSKIMIKVNKNKVKLTKEEKKELREKEKLEKKELKNLKREFKKIDPSTENILPFLDADIDNTFITKTGFLDIYQVVTKDIYSFSDYDIKLHIYNYIAFLRSYVNDIKFISMNFPVNTSENQEYIRKKMLKTDNPIFLESLQEKLDQFEFLEKHRTNREYYIMVFSDKEKKHMMSNLLRNQTRIFVLKEMSLEKKIKIIFKLNNLNTKII